ncbi:MAG: TrkH family potassium uptake protein [Bacteroidales bacterium]
MNIKLIARYTGIALLFNALFMFISALVSMIYGFDSSFSPLVISTFITASVGVFPFIFVKKSEDINIKEGFIIIILSWLLVCLFGMMPYILWGENFTLMNAWFESVSGYTTTGSTILTEVEAVPKGLLFWRSSTHFIGGIGVVIFMLLVLPAVSTFRLRISKMEISALSKENYKFKTKETVKIISIVYLGITVLSTIFLMISGMNFYDAINHAFSIVATGGFSTKNQSLMSFHSFPIEFTAMFFMLCAGTHFGLLYQLIVHGSTKIFKSPIIKLYLGTVFFSSILVAIDIYSGGIAANWGQALRLAFFQVISLNTTSGFATANTSIWPQFSIMLLMLLSIFTACSGSTTGGIKADRTWILFNSVKIQLRKQLHPKGIIPLKIGHTLVPNDTLFSVLLFIGIYFLIMFICALLLSATGIPFIESISASVAHIGNVGPGFGRCGSLGNYLYFNDFAKFILTIEMLLGRLELFTLLMLFVIFKKN